MDKLYHSRFPCAIGRFFPHLSGEGCSSSFVVVVLSALNHDHLRSVFPAGPQPRSSALTVPCRTSTATICAECSLPDLSRDHLRSALSVPCRTSTVTLCGQCSLPDLNCDLLCSAVAAGPQP